MSDKEEKDNNNNNDSPSKITLSITSTDHIKRTSFDSLLKCFPANKAIQSELKKSLRFYANPKQSKMQYPNTEPMQYPRGYKRFYPPEVISAIQQQNKENKCELGGKPSNK